jgi:hypothetical protein
VLDLGDRRVGVHLRPHQPAERAQRVADVAEQQRERGPDVGGVLLTGTGRPGHRPHGVRDRPEHAPDGDRRVLQRLQRVAQHGADLRRPERADVELAALLGARHDVVEPDDVAAEPARLVEPAPARSSARSPPRRSAAAPSSRSASRTAKRSTAAPASIERTAGGNSRLTTKPTAAPTTVSLIRPSAAGPAP